MCSLFSWEKNFFARLEVNLGKFDNNQKATQPTVTVPIARAANISSFFELSSDKIESNSIVLIKGIKDKH